MIDFELKVILIVCGLIFLGLAGGMMVAPLIGRGNGLKNVELNQNLIVSAILMVNIVAGGFGIISSFLSIFLSGLIAAQFIIGFPLVGVMMGLAIKRSRLVVENFLFDLGRADGVMGFMWGGVASLNCFAMVLQGYNNSELNLDRIVFALSHGMFAFMGLVLAFGRVYITTDGISRFGGTTTWKEITGYDWVNPKKKTITLIVKGPLRREYSIPIKHQEQIEHILRARLNRLPQPFDFEETFI